MFNIKLQLQNLEFPEATDFSFRSRKFGGYLILLNLFQRLQLGPDVATLSLCIMEKGRYRQKEVSYSLLWT